MPKHPTKKKGKGGKKMSNLLAAPAVFPGRLGTEA